MSSDAKDKAAVRVKVEALLSEGFYFEQRDPAIRVGEPLVISYPGGGQHSWFVPLLIGTKLAGFAQILPSLVPLRVSSFRKHSQDCDACPDAADWIDADHIMARAASVARADEQLSGPVLTFDQVPDRIAWKVLAKSASGEAPRILFVAGSAVYEGKGSKGLGP